MEKATLLQILYNICHWLGDYTHLSTKWMLDAKRVGKPLGPIFIHALVHTALMTLVSMLFTTDEVVLITIFLFQLITHFSIDILKGKLNVWFPVLADSTKKSHWYIFGGDQMAHQIVIILQTYFLTQFLI